MPTTQPQAEPRLDYGFEPGELQMLAGEDESGFFESLSSIFKLS